MLDKFVEKDLRESGCKANRILRIVKNKKGRCCNIPLMFDGNTQSFQRAFVPNPNWAQAQKEKVSKNKKTDSSGKKSRPEYEQLPLNTPIPF